MVKTKSRNTKKQKDIDIEDLDLLEDENYVDEITDKEEVEDVEEETEESDRKTKETILKNQGKTKKN